MLLRITFFAAFLVVLSVPSKGAILTTQAADPEQITVHIRVVDADTHKGLEGVHLYLTVNGKFQKDSLVTDKNGVREFKVPVGSNFEVDFWYQGSVGFFHTYTSFAAKEPPPPSLVLALDQDPPKKLESLIKYNRLAAIQKTAATVIAADADKRPKVLLVNLQKKELETLVRELCVAPSDDKLAPALKSSGMFTLELLEQCRGLK